MVFLMFCEFSLNLMWCNAILCRILTLFLNFCVSRICMSYFGFDLLLFTTFWCRLCIDPLFVFYGLQSILNNTCFRLQSVSSTNERCWEFVFCMDIRVHVVRNGEHIATMLNYCVWVQSPLNVNLNGKKSLKMMQLQNLEFLKLMKKIKR